MKLLIHASLDFKQKMIEVKESIESVCNIEVLLPDLNRYQYIRDEEGDDKTFTAIKHRLTNENIKNIENSSILLILNYTHRGIRNYIGGNSFLEMVVAYYLKMPVILVNPIPEGMPYTEEIKSMYPIIADGEKEIVYIIQRILDS